MSDDFSQLDAAIDAKFRAVGWRQAGEPFSEDELAAQRNGNAQHPPTPGTDDPEHPRAQLNGTIDPSTLQSIEDRLGVVAEVLHRRSAGNAGPGGGSDAQFAVLRTEMAALRTDMTEVRARLEALTTVLVEFGNTTRRTMASTTTELLLELGKLGEGVSRLSRLTVPRPTVSRNRNRPQVGER